jgi:hypothetical protein
MAILPRDGTPTLFSSPSEAVFRTFCAMHNEIRRLVLFDLPTAIQLNLAKKFQSG